MIKIAAAEFKVLNGNLPYRYFGEINFALHSTYSYFGFAEDTPSRQIANKFAFALDLFVSLS